MLFLDPEQTPANFANTAAHELHHIGLAAACRAVPATVFYRYRCRHREGERLA